MKLIDIYTILDKNFAISIFDSDTMFNYYEGGIESLYYEDPDDLFSKEINQISMELDEETGRMKYKVLVQFYTAFFSFINKKFKDISETTLKSGLYDNTFVDITVLDKEYNVKYFSLDNRLSDSVLKAINSYGINELCHKLDYDFTIVGIYATDIYEVDDSLIKVGEIKKRKYEIKVRFLDF